MELSPERFQLLSLAAFVLYTVWGVLLVWAGRHGQRMMDRGSLIRSATRFFLAGYFFTINQQIQNWHVLETSVEAQHYLSHTADTMLHAFVLLALSDVGWFTADWFLAQGYADLIEFLGRLTERAVRLKRRWRRKDGAHGCQ